MANSHGLKLKQSPIVGPKCCQDKSICTQHCAPKTQIKIAASHQFWSTIICKSWVCCFDAFPCDVPAHLFFLVTACLHFCISCIWRRAPSILQSCPFPKLDPLLVASLDLFHPGYSSSGSRISNDQHTYLKNKRSNPSDARGATLFHAPLLPPQQLPSCHPNRSFQSPEGQCHDAMVMGT